MIKNLPKLSELYNFISIVPNYPVTAHQLVQFAASSGVNNDVVYFYKAFGDITFDNKSDLATTSLQVESLNREEKTQPLEIEVATEEF